MKKKEREQALERHAKDLEDRLNKMERDMDGLRKGESGFFPQQSSPWLTFGLHRWTPQRTAG
jgi:hypothetical protein